MSVEETTTYYLHWKECLNYSHLGCSYQYEMSQMIMKYGFLPEPFLMTDNDVGFFSVLFSIIYFFFFFHASHGFLAASQSLKNR